MSAEPESQADAAASLPRIVHIDDQLLVVDKPAGMVVHPGAANTTGTLAQLLGELAAGGPEPQRAGIVHRLDRDTSGLLLVARSQQAHERLQAAIAARAVRREYLALVRGRPSARSGTIEAPIGRDPRVRTRMAIGGSGARPARTDFQLLQQLDGRSLLRLRLQTGRTHQIRVHLAAVGLPVCGDPLYGAAGDLQLDRQFLHACSLAFEHPFSGEMLQLHSQLPADLQLALRAAGGAQPGA